MKKKYKIGPVFVAKVLLLVLMFFTAIYTMYYLNTKGLQQTPVAEIFGFNQQEEWKVCSKDLLSFSMDTENPKTSWKILKMQDSWKLLFNGSSESINADQLKTCMERICKIKVTKATSQEFVNFQESISYQFSDMTSLIIRLNAKEKTIFWDGNLYQAADLIEFLAEVPKHHCK